MTKHIVLLCADVPKEASFIKKFTLAAQKRNLKMTHLDPQRMMMALDQQNKIKIYEESKEVEFSSDTFIFIKKAGHAHDFVAALYDYAKIKGIRYTDESRRYHRVNTKAHEMVILSQNGLSYPPTIVTTPSGFLSNKSIISKLVTFPLVLKGSGNNGKGVWLVKDEKELEEKFSSAELLANNFTGTVLLQEYVPNQFDIRILVYKDQVLWALKRAATDGFYNNRSRGGDVEQIAISDAEAQVAIKAAKVMEIDLAGVDLVRTTSGYYLWEVNKSAMTDQSMELTGIDVPALIIDSID